MSLLQLSPHLFSFVMILAQKAGLDPNAVAPASIILPAHMFAFYFGIIADVTPPVALAAFAGAGIKANSMKPASTPPNWLLPPPGSQAFLY